MKVLLMLTLAGCRKRVKKRRLSHQDIRRALIPARFPCGSRQKRLREYIYSTPWMLVQCIVYEATMESVTKSLLNIENFTKLTYILHFIIIFFFRQIKVFRFPTRQSCWKCAIPFWIHCNDCFKNATPLHSIQW